MARFEASISEQKAVTILSGRPNNCKAMKSIPIPLQSEPNVIEPGNRGPRAGTLACWEARAHNCLMRAALASSPTATAEQVVLTALWRCGVLMVLITGTGFFFLGVAFVGFLFFDGGSSESDEPRRIIFRRGAAGESAIPPAHLKPWAESAGQRSPAISLGQESWVNTCVQHAAQGSPTVVGSPRGWCRCQCLGPAVVTRPSRQ